MPHKAQWHAPKSYAQPIIARLHCALSVKQKLKLHHGSLRSRGTKTIPIASSKFAEGFVLATGAENPLPVLNRKPGENWKRPHRRERRRSSFFAGTSGRESATALSIIRLKFFRVAVKRLPALKRPMSGSKYAVLARPISKILSSILENISINFTAQRQGQACGCRRRPSGG